MKTIATTLGLKKSFGFGDRLGLATPGHVKAAEKYDFAGIFAQQSIREMARTNRTPDEVMQAARNTLESLGYTKAWGADADHLKTFEDIEYTAAAGFCFFTIDPSEYVRNEADHADQATLEEELRKQVEEEILPENWEELYLNKKFTLQSGRELSFTREKLLRAITKYGRAVAHCERMAEHMSRVLAGNPYEIEVSVDETDSPTTFEEHLFFALELKRRDVKVISLAPRFIGEFEKGIDYKGSLEDFRQALEVHVEIAKTYGPYKISIHSGSDKFSIYPIIGEVCGELLHVKTAGTSYLEALRAVARKDIALFQEIVNYSNGRFSEDKKSYHISVSDADIPTLAKTASKELEEVYLNQDKGRQVLHVTFGSVLTKGQTAKGGSFKDAILEVLIKDPALHEELLDIHFSKHLGGLSGKSL